MHSLNATLNKKITGTTAHAVYYFLRVTHVSRPVELCGIVYTLAVSVGTFTFALYNVEPADARCSLKIYLRSQRS